MSMYGVNAGVPKTLVRAVSYTHLISSVQDADKIIVLNNGEINAVGTHEELLKSNPIYREEMCIRDSLCRH